MSNIVISIELVNKLFSITYGHFCNLLSLKWGILENQHYVTSNQCAWVILSFDTTKIGACFVKETTQVTYFSRRKFDSGPTTVY
jgi:hypothetical protein